MAQQGRIGTTATNISTRNGTTIVRYHFTDVVTFDAKTITLNHGGWITNTTRNRMNQASNQYDLGFRVYQKNYSWYVDFKHGTTPFFDNIMVLSR